jgi:surface antigen
MAVILTLALGGCMGLAKLGSKHLFGKSKQPPAERIAAAQETAISLVHGGSAGTPILWSDQASGLHGALVPDAAGAAPPGCRDYRQTVILAGETLTGKLIACAQKDGTWKLFGGLPPAQAARRAGA